MSTTSQTGVQTSVMAASVSWWDERNDLEKEACVGSPPRAEYGKAHVWGIGGELRTLWEGKNDDGLEAELLTILDKDENRRTIYETNDKNQCSRPLLNMYIAGSTADVVTATPLIVIKCSGRKPHLSRLRKVFQGLPATLSTNKVGLNFRRLLDQVRPDLRTRYGLEIYVTHKSVLWAGCSVEGDKAEDEPNSRHVSALTIYGSTRTNDHRYGELIDRAPATVKGACKTSIVAGKPIYSLPDQKRNSNTAPFGTFGRVLHLLPGFKVGVTTYHSLYQELTHGINDVFIEESADIDGNDHYQLRCDQLWNIFASRTRHIGLFNHVNAGDGEAGMYASEEHDYLMFAIADSRVNDVNQVLHPTEGLIEVTACMTDPGVPEQMEALFNGATSGVSVGPILPSLCSIPVDDGTRCVRAWEMWCKCGDSGAWVVSLKGQIVLGVIFAFSPEDETAYVIPARDFFDPIYDLWRGPALASVQDMFKPLVITKSFLDANHGRIQDDHLLLEESAEESTQDWGFSVGGTEGAFAERMSKSSTMFEGVRDPLANKDSTSLDRDPAVPRQSSRIDQLHFLTPEKEFETQPAYFYQPGRVLRIRWTEPRGWTTQGLAPNESTYETLRLMVVVKASNGHCICVPINTYKGQGVAKPGLKEAAIRQHAIIHMENKSPTLKVEEKKFESIMLDPFAVVPFEKATLAKLSRVRFDQAYTILFNLGVCNIGMVRADQIERLRKCFEEAN